MSQRWWQNRIYGLQFGTLGDSFSLSYAFVLEAIRGTETALENPKVSRSAKNNLKGYASGLQDAKQAIEEVRNQSVGAL